VRPSAMLTIRSASSLIGLVSGVSLAPASDVSRRRPTSARAGLRLHAFGDALEHLIVAARDLKRFLRRHAASAPNACGSAIPRAFDSSAAIRRASVVNGICGPGPGSA